MSIVSSNIIAGSSGQGGGYNLTNSLRFRSSASAYLNRTFGTPTSTTTWSLSFWLKRGNLTANAQVFSAGGDFVYFGGGTFTIKAVSGAVLETTQVFRDPSAWYHFLVVADTSNATANNRVRLYVNGTEVTAFSSRTNPSISAATIFNASSSNNRIGGTGSTEFFDGYLTEVNFIDGQALTPSSFGETSSTTGVWIPKKYTGTYGTNGFYLPFTDNSALTTSSNAGLGKDFSGNGNYWTTNNISITSGTTYDSMTDVPTLTSATTANYCTWNPLNRRTTTHIKTASAGNLNVSGDTDNTGLIYATIYPTTGKWYFEFSPANTYANSYIGIGANNCESINSYPGNSTSSVGLEIGSGKVYKSSLQATYTGISAGEIGMIAWDCDTGKVWMGRQGTWFNSGDPAAGTGQVATLTAGENGAMVTPYSSSGIISTTFGQRPFAYTPPTGFVALNTYNLPTPTIGATTSTQANKYMDATLYTGTSATQSIVNAAGFKPDLVWMKSRSNAQDNYLLDSVRGATKDLYSNLTNAETTNANSLTAFNSNGYTLGSGGANFTGYTYVGWQWQAGQGSSSSNTNGSITSTVSVNATAGFSIVTWTGNGASSATIGHGLGVAPSMIIVKNRSATWGWFVYNKFLTNPNTGRLQLNLTNGEIAGGTPGPWNNTAPTSTVFSLGDSTFPEVNGSGNLIVAYCFAPIAGYSAFGSYTGNGSSDGTFVYTGFRPRFVMWKNSTQGSQWILLDTARNTYNVSNAYLEPNTSDAENTANTVFDILSNGFKLRNSGGTDFNESANTYIYAAFAEYPFKYANAR